MDETQSKADAVEEVENGRIDEIPSPQMIVEERDFVPVTQNAPLPKGMIVTPMEEIVVTEITG